MITRTNVLGSLYSNLPFAAAVDYLCEQAKSGASGYVCVSNVHTTMMGYFDPSYQEITNQSLVSVPDGMPLCWMMRLQGQVQQDRIRGPSLMRRVCDRGRRHQIKHFLFGATDETLLRLQSYLQKEYPGIAIVGIYSPPFKEFTESDFAAFADLLNSSGAHMIWIGLGAPKQERFMWEMRQRLRGIQFGIGAAFDILPGNVVEAPMWMQSAGLEWIYRFVQEPKRLWRRYVLYNPLFVIFALIQLLKVKMGIKNV